ncbi:hypothetical protein BC829DRAFT_431061 [Chytridium lagenaria]|nr:hypothetical protein BC829DRAFT_431061 [Chytridium lagenaria]
MKARHFQELDRSDPTLLTKSCYSRYHKRSLASRQDLIFQHQSNYKFYMKKIWSAKTSIRYYILTLNLEEKLNKKQHEQDRVARKWLIKKRSDRIFMKQDLQNYFTAPPENPPSELNPEVDYGDSVLRGVIDKYQDALIKIQSHEEYIEELLDAELTEADKAHIKLAVRTERQRRKMSGRFMQAEELEPDDTVVNSTTEEITNSTVQEIGNSTVQEIANSTVHDLPAGTPQETREKEATDAELKIQLSKTYSDPDDIETALFFLAEGLGL